MFRQSGLSQQLGNLPPLRGMRASGLFIPLQYIHGTSMDQTFLQSTEYLTLSSGMLCDSRVSDVTKFFLTMKTCLLPGSLRLP